MGNCLSPPGGRNQLNSYLKPSSILSCTILQVYVRSYDSLSSIFFNINIISILSMRRKDAILMIKIDDHNLNAGPKRSLH